MRGDYTNMDELVWGRETTAPVEKVFTYLDKCACKQADFRVINRVKSNLRATSLIDIQIKVWANIK